MESLRKSKLIKYTLIGAAVVALTGLIGITSYYLYTKGQIEKKPTINVTEEKEQNYPKETIIEKTDEENVVRITPSKEDAVQKKTPDGNYIEVPKPTVPPPPPSN